jgi:hypothetical protein
MDVDVFHPLNREPFTDIHRHDKLMRWMDDNRETLQRMSDVITDWRYRRKESTEHDCTLVNVGLWRESEGPPERIGAFSPWGALYMDSRVPVGFMVLLGKNDRFLALLPLGG